MHARDHLVACGGGEGSGHEHIVALAVTHAHGEVSR
jgi:hypothetical protein